MFSLRKRLSNFSQFPPDLSSKLFDSLIRPIVTYGNEIADYSINLNNVDLLPPEKLHHKSLRKLLRVQLVISINCYYISVLWGLSFIVIQTNIKFLKITVTWTNIW